MKRFLIAYLSGLATLSLFIGLVANAQSVSTPNYWRTNIPSSTITPINASLQVPCANIVGGCGGGGGSSTILYQGYAITLTPNPINTTGTVAVNTSTLTSYIATLGYLTSASGTAEFYPLSSNPSNFTTTTIQSVLNSLSAVGLATYNSSTGQFSVSSSSLNLGTASHYSFSDFLPSSTLYLATNTGDWAGTWQGVNSSTFYLASNPAGYVTSTSGGSVSTSSAVTVTNFPLWTSTTGALSGTSSISEVTSTGNVTLANNLSIVGSTAIGTSFAIAGTPRGFANPISIGGVNPPAFIYLDSNYNALRIGAQSGSTNQIDFELPSGGGDYQDVVGLSTSAVQPAEAFDNDIALGVAAQRWNSLYIGTGSSTLQGNVFVGGTLNASGTITQAGVPVGFGTVTTSSAGTANTLPLWTSGSALGNSVISQNGTTTTIAASTTVIGNQTTTFQIFSNGHINSTGTIPTISSCGTSPTSTGSDAAGSVTVGSVSATTCTLTFAAAYKNVPSCTVTGQTGTIALTYALTTSTIIVTNAALTGDKFNYQCWAQE